ncbi:MAG: exodeoxyribonuclease VII large subunit [Bacilli bacterium]|jgi:exodeoxyribonuclease VII large subunit
MTSPKSQEDSGRTFSVGQLSALLKGCFSNPLFHSLTVYGEIFQIHPGKYTYIELGDQGKKETNSPIVKCAFATYYGDGYGLGDLKPGDVISVTGSLTYYEHGCSLTLWGESTTLLSSQTGKNLLLRKKTLEKLEKLGYLEESRKKPIPRFCRKVAVLTAETGAAYQDILKTLHDRFPVSSVLFPVTVQGENAAKSILAALEEAKKGDFDVILLGRGGGSKTDLSCFDDEKVALSIATSPVPVITAIGHTVDTSIADRVSDRMAITPTEGASLINPSLADIEEEKEAILEGLRDGYLSILREKRLALEGLRNALLAYSPSRLLSGKEEKRKSLESSLSIAFLAKASQYRQEKESLSSALEDGLSYYLGKKKAECLALAGNMEALSPLLILDKGYAQVFQDGILVRHPKDLHKGSAEIAYPEGRRKVDVSD